MKISCGRTAVGGGTAIWLGMMTFEDVRGVALVHRRRLLRSVSVELHGPKHMLVLEARWLPRLP